jgi:hypothetical protein
MKRAIELLKNLFKALIFAMGTRLRRGWFFLFTPACLVRGLPLLYVGYQDKRTCKSKRIPYFPKPNFDHLPAERSSIFEFTNAFVEKNFYIKLSKR